MTIANAIKKLSKYGKVNRGRNGQYWAIIGNYKVSFTANGEDIPTNSITCEHTCRVGLEPDYNTDYFPGTFWDNLTQAINAAIRWQASDNK